MASFDETTFDCCVFCIFFIYCSHHGCKRASTTALFDKTISFLGTGGYKKLIDDCFVIFGSRQAARDTRGCCHHPMTTMSLCRPEEVTLWRTMLFNQFDQSISSTCTSAYSKLIVVCCVIFLVIKPELSIFFDIVSF